MEVELEFKLLRIIVELTLLESCFFGDFVELEEEEVEAEILLLLTLEDGFGEGTVTFNCWLFFNETFDDTLDIDLGDFGDRILLLPVLVDDLDVLDVEEVGLPVEVDVVFFVPGDAFELEDMTLLVRVELGDEGFFLTGFFFTRSTIAGWRLAEGRNKEYEEGNFLRKVHLSL